MGLADPTMPICSCGQSTGSCSRSVCPLCQSVLDRVDEIAETQDGAR